MSDVMVKIMVEVLSVLALATKQINQGRFSKWPAAHRYFLVERRVEKFAKKLLGESEVEAVLQRLDRLTQEEAQMTVAQTLDVVHGLFDNLRVVMDGACTLGVHQSIDEVCSGRWKGNNRWHTECSGYV
jgi:hypothetical protein